MSLTYDVLGGPGEDNAVLVRVDSGQSIGRLLFDCGEGCLRQVPHGEILALDHLFFSHLHMDHVAGFDTFFRSNYQRATLPNHVWGPPRTAEIIHHRLQGYLWNLHEQMAATWWLHDIYPNQQETFCTELTSAFTSMTKREVTAHSGIVLEAPTYSVEAITLDHHTPVIGYVVREPTRWNIDPHRLQALGLVPGPWVAQLKSQLDGEILVNGEAYNLPQLRAQLLTETPGESLAYLTDFLLDDAAFTRLTKFLTGCQTIICEAQYKQEDVALAERHGHLTSVLTARLAAAVEAQKLTLMHVSSRYQSDGWVALLREAQAIFPATEFPVSWNLGR